MNNLKRLRKSKRLTQTGVAQLMDIDRSTYSRYETGEIQPDNDKLRKLSEIFQVSIDYILGGKGAGLEKSNLIPILGSVPAGTPIEAIEDIEEYIPYSKFVKYGEVFALRTVDMIPYELKVMLSFSGNTMPVKDDIKALGYKWGEKAPAGALGIFGKPEKAWHKIINPEDIETELPKLAGLNPQIKNNISPIDMAMWQQKLASQAEQQERVDAVKASMPKPVRPEKLTAGARWNGKIYGKSGYKNIYLDNVKINLTDAEAQEIETWQAEVAKYNKAIADAKKG